jgi:hypothetical protein
VVFLGLQWIVLGWLTARHSPQCVGLNRPDQPGRQIRTIDVYEVRDDSTAVLSYGDYFEMYRQHPEGKAVVDEAPLLC